MAAEQRVLLTRSHLGAVRQPFDVGLFRNQRLFQEGTLKVAAISNLFQFFCCIQFEQREVRVRLSHRSCDSIEASQLIAAQIVVTRRRFRVGNDIRTLPRSDML